MSAQPIEGGEELTLPVEPSDTRTPDIAPAKPKSRRPTTRAGRRAEAERVAQERELATLTGAKPKADRKPRTPRSTKPANNADVVRAVKELHEFAGGGLSMVGRDLTGFMLESSGQEAGEAWAAAARRYPVIARMFGGTSDGLVLFRLAMVYAPIVQVVMAEASMDAETKAATLQVLKGETSTGATDSV